MKIVAYPKMKISNAPRATNCATEGIKNLNTIEDTSVIKDTKRINPEEKGQKLILRFSFILKNNEKLRTDHHTKYLPNPDLQIRRPVSGFLQSLFCIVVQASCLTKNENYPINLIFLYKQINKNFPNLIRIV